MKIFFFALFLITMNARADRVVACATGEMQLALDRFHVPQRGFIKDPVWSGLMEDSVRYGVSILNEDPDLSFEIFAGKIATRTRESLQERSLLPSNKRDELVKLHADSFGTDRVFDSVVAYLENYDTDLATRAKAIEYVNKYGKETASEKTGAKLRGFQIIYESPDGPIELNAFKTYHDDAGKLINIHITPLRSVVPALKSMDVIFQRLRQLKHSLDQGNVTRSEEVLQRVKSEVSEIYWLISQAWPYKRGSASIADLTTRSIYDWFGIENTPWNEATNPNIVAMISPLADFKKDYDSLMQAPLKWKEDVKE